MLSGRQGSIGAKADHVEWLARQQIGAKADHFECRLKCKHTVEGLMASYLAGDWIWNESLSNELARMLLPLAWVVRAVDALIQQQQQQPPQPQPQQLRQLRQHPQRQKPQLRQQQPSLAGNVAAARQYRVWLRRIASDLLASQHPCGAIKQEFGKGAEANKCSPCAPGSNAAYGSGEGPIMFDGTEAVTDALYTLNFALAGRVVTPLNFELSRSTPLVSPDLLLVSALPDRVEPCEGREGRCRDLASPPRGY
jgi:hypothetical protein